MWETLLQRRSVTMFTFLIKDNRIFIIEMQVTDRKNLPFRLRYYLGQIDQELLKPNDDYRVLAKYPT